MTTAINENYVRNVISEIYSITISKSSIEWILQIIQHFAKYSAGEMLRNGIQHNALPDDPDSFFSLLLILLCGLVWFYAYKCYICLPISAHGMINDFNFVCSTHIC